MYLVAGIGALYRDHGKITAFPYLNTELRRVAFDPCQVFVSGSSIDHQAKSRVRHEINDQIVYDAATLVEHAGI